MKINYITPKCEINKIAAVTIIATSPDTTTLEGSNEAVDPSDARVKEEQFSPSGDNWDEW